MVVVDLKCSNCGAKLDLIDSKSAIVYCQYCNSKLLVKELMASNTPPPSQTNNTAAISVPSNKYLQNLLTQAQVSFSTKDDDECIKYCKKALEIDANCWKAWELRSNSMLRIALINKSTSALNNAWTVKKKCVTPPLSNQVKDPTFLDSLDWAVVFGAEICRRLSKVEQSRPRSFSEFVKEYFRNISAVLHDRFAKISPDTTNDNEREQLDSQAKVENQICDLLIEVGDNIFKVTCNKAEDEENYSPYWAIEYYQCALAYKSCPSDEFRINLYIKQLEVYKKAFRNILNNEAKERVKLKYNNTIEEINKLDVSLEFADINDPKANPYTGAESCLYGCQQGCLYCSLVILVWVVCSALFS